MNDQELKNLVSFLAHVETSSGLMSKSPEQLKTAYNSFALSAHDTSPRLDLAGLNLYTDWLKQWRPDLAPHGGAKPPENLPVN